MHSVVGFRNHHVNSMQVSFSLSASNSNHLLGNNRALPEQGAAEQMEQSALSIDGLWKEVHDLWQSKVNSRALTQSVTQWPGQLLQGARNFFGFAKEQGSSPSRPLTSEEAAKEAAKLEEDKRAVEGHLKALLQSPVIPMDDKLFQHIVGGHFGKDTGLEGYFPPPMLNYFLSFMLKKIELLEQKPFCPADSKLNFCRALLGKNHGNDALLNENVALKLFKEIRNQLAVAKELSLFNPFYDFAKFPQKVRSLKDGESFFFQGGWVDDSGGHSVVYEVIKQQNGLFTFRVYNRGEGAEYHTDKKVDAVLHGLPFTELVNISENNLTAPLFIHALKELAFSHTDDPLVKWQPRDLYEVILPLLEGEQSKAIYSSDLLMEILATGHCSFLSLEGWLSTYLEPRSSRSYFDLLQVEMQLKALKDYHEQNAARFKNDEQARRLLGMGIKQVAFAIGEVRNKGLGEEGISIAFLNEELSKMQAFLQEAQSAYDLSAKQNVPLLAIHPLSPLQSATALTLPNAPSATLPPSSLPTPSPSSSVGTLHWKYDAKTILGDLQILHGQIHAANQAEDFSIAKEAIQTLAHKIPLDWVMVPKEQWATHPTFFLQSLNEKEGKELLSLMAKLSQEYLWSIYKSGKESFGIKIDRNVQDVLVQLKLFALSSAIADHFKEQWGFEFPHLYQETFSFILNGRMGASHLNDPAWDDERRLLRHYWQQVNGSNFPQETRLDFFGFDGIEVAGMVSHELSEEKRKEGDIDLLSVSFAEKWIQRSDVQVKIDELKKKDPKLEKIDFKGWVAYAMGDKRWIKTDELEGKLQKVLLKGDELLLPKAFFDLRDLALISNFLLTTKEITYRCHGQTSRFDAGINYEVERNAEIRDYRKNYCWKTEYSIFDCKFVSSLFMWNWFSNNPNYPRIMREPLLGRYDLSSRSPVQLIFSFEQGNELLDLDSYLTFVYQKPEFINYDYDTAHFQNNYLRNSDYTFSARVPMVRRREAPHERLVATSGQTVNLRDHRQLLALSSIPELQIQESFVYFSHYPHLLEQPKYRLFFKRLMQDSGLLIDHFLKSPEQSARFAQQLAGFCQAGLERYTLIKDQEMRAYFLELSHFFSRYASYVQKKYPDSFPKGFVLPFNDVLGEMRKLAQSSEIPEELRSVLLVEVTKSYAGEESLSDRAIQDLIVAAIAFCQYPPSIGPFWGIDKEKERSRLWAQLRPSLVEGLKDPQRRKKILDAVFKEAQLPLFQNVQWESRDTFPLYRSSDHTLAINVLEGTLFQHYAHEATVLPSWFLSHPFIIEKFGKQKLLGSVVGSVAQFFNEKGNVYRAQILWNQKKNGYDVIGFQQEWNGRYYQPISSDLLKDQIPISILRENECWLTDEEPAEIIVLDSATKQKKYRIALTKDPQGASRYSVSSLFLLDAAGQQTTFSLANIYKDKREHQALERFENRGDVLVWQKPSTASKGSIQVLWDNFSTLFTVPKEKGCAEKGLVPARIELPRFGLSFEVEVDNGVTRAVCQQEELAGFALAEQQHLPQLGDITTYLVLEKKEPQGKTKKVVLIPRQEMQKLARPLYTETVAERHLGKTKQEYFIYDFVKSTKVQEGFVLRPRTRKSATGDAIEDGRFHLALLQLWERDYGAAFQTLQGYGTQHRPYQKEEIEVLRKIAQLDEKNKDHTPEALVVRLRAYFCLWRDKMDFNKKIVVEDPKELEGIERLHQKYLSKKHLLKNFSLSQEEESFFQDIFFHSSDSSIEASISISVQPLIPLPQSESDNRLSQFLRGSPGEFYDHHLQALKNRSTQPILLRNKILKDFVSHYTLIHGGKDQDLATSFELLTGLSSSTSLPIKKELQKALSLISRSAPLPADRVAAAILLKVLNNRGWLGESTYPSPEEVKNNLAEIQGGYLQEKWRKKEWIERNLIQGILPQDFTTPIAVEHIESWSDVVKGWLGGWFPSLSAELVDQLEQTKKAGLQVGVNRIVPTGLVKNSHSNLAIKEALIPKLAEIISELPLQEKEKQELLQKSQGLQKAFEISSDNPVINRAFANARKQVEDYSQVRLAKKKYEVNNGELLGKFRSLLALQEKELMEAEIPQKTKELLTLANKLPEDKIAREQEIRARLAKEKSPLDVEAIAHLCRTKDKKKIGEKLPALSAEEIQELYDKWKELYLLFTYQQQVARIGEGIDKIDKAKARKASPLELSSLVGQLASMAQATRHYDVNEHPDFLVLEYNSKLLLRKDQIDDLQKLSVYEPHATLERQLGVALEKPTGTGKSAVLAPLQAFRDADGENIPIVVVPEELMADTSRDLQEKLGINFSKLVEIFSIERDSKLDLAGLQRLLDRLNWIRKDERGEKAGRKILMISNSSLQSLVLKFVEMSLQSSSGSSVEIDLFRQVIHTLITRGVLTLDELHDLLLVSKEHHFTFGAPTPVKPEVVSAVCDFYDYIATDPQIKANMAFNFLPVAEKTAQPFTKEAYHAKIKPLLIQAIVEGGLLKDNPEAVAFFKKLSPEERSLVAGYLNKTQSIESYAFVGRREHSNAIKNMLYALQQMVSEIFPLTAAKQCGENFGPLPDDAKKAIRQRDPDVAVPYHKAKAPAVRAQPGTELEALSETLHMHLFRSLEEKIVRKEIESIKVAIIEELKNNSIKKVQESESYQFFKKLIGSKEIDLFSLKEEDYRLIAQNVNKDFSTLIQLTRRHILPQIELHLQQLSTNAQIYRLFKSVKGFSATLWNSESYPQLFHEIIPSQALGEALSVLWENSPSQVAIVQRKAPKEEAEVTSFVKELYDKGMLPSGSFADASAFFGNVDNEVVAKAIMALPCWAERKPAIEGIVFYKGDEKMILLRGQKEPVRYAESELSREENKEKLIAFWDQQHCLGSDIPLGLSMTAAISVGQQTMLHEIVQAAGRLRKLREGQRAYFVTTAEDAKIIATTVETLTGEKIGKELQLKHLLIYALHKEALRRGEHNHRAFKQDMEGALISRALEVVVDPAVSVDQAIGLMKELQELFLKTIPENPYEAGGLERTDTARLVVEEEKKRFLASKPMQLFEKHPLLAKRFDIAAIKAEIDAIAKRAVAHLPNVVTLSSSTQRYSREVTLALETNKETQKAIETQKELETHKQTQMDVEADVQEGKLEALPVVEWDGRGIFESKTFVPTPAATIAKLSLEKVSHSAQLPQGLPMVMKVDEALAHHAFTKEYATIFDDPDLLITINQAPLYQHDARYVPYKPFGNNHDNDPHVIIALQEGKLKLILGDQADANMFDKFLKEAPKDSKGDLHPILYCLGTGIERQGPKAIEEASLAKHKQWIPLITKAKFFKGELNYTSEELAFLEQWMKEKGAKRMHEFFTTKIIASSKMALDQFPHSSINKLFLKVL